MDSKNPSGAKSRAEVYDWIQCIIFALVFCVLLFVFGARMVNVVGLRRFRRGAHGSRHGEAGA